MLLLSVCNSYSLRDVGKGKATSNSSRIRIRATLMIYLFKNLHLKAKIKLLLIWLLFAHPQFRSLTTSALALSQGCVKLSLLRVFKMDFLFIYFFALFSTEKEILIIGVFLFIYQLNVSGCWTFPWLCAVDVKKDNICRVSQRLWEILFEGFRPSVGPMVIKSRINS